MKQTGEKLRARREEQGLSLNEISVTTKINVRVLQAIEAGNRGDLPSLSYVKGFVRSYARALGLGEEEVMTVFREETEPPSKPLETESVLPEPPPTKPVVKPATGLLGSRFVLVGGILLLIGLIVGVKSLVDKYEQERVVRELPENIESLPEPAVPPAPETPEVQVSEATREPPKSAQSSPPPPPVPVNEPPPVGEVSPLDKVRAMAEPIEVKRREEAAAAAEEARKKQEAAAAAEEARKKQEAAAADEEARKQTEAPVAVGQEVILEALNKVTVRYRVDDGPSKGIDLAPDQIFRIKGTSSISLVLSDGGAVNIIHNGRDRGVPGDMGKPFNIKFP